MSFSLTFFTVVIFLSLPDGGNAGEDVCPPGFQFHGHKCYKALGLFASWQEAKGYCATMGGDLASAQNLKEQTILSGIMTAMHGISPLEIYWIDGSNMMNENEWRWMNQNGASVPFSYTNWATGYPVKSWQRCIWIAYGTNGNWYNDWCHKQLSFICEARPISKRLEILHYQNRQSETQRILHI
ncbi:hypothetical protein CHS0354_024271 [Potamilus streckersoni]|uniref:C-type lectin domain-containing protein n=1 Tax=Potamilus streckersoni TaxID=2493646 RepID=A0AAE0SLU1_9BIVA|nr:hypothetical protein CHS0354_024271 [Potamilus streckersoni]